MTAPISGEAGEAEIVVDLVYVRAGRGVFMAYFIEAFEPFDERLRGTLTAKAVDRVSAALSD